jgi:hypothetical protein
MSLLYFSATAVRLRSDHPGRSIGGVMLEKRLSEGSGDHHVPPSDLIALLHATDAKDFLG